MLATEIFHSSDLDLLSTHPTKKMNLNMLLLELHKLEQTYTMFLSSPPTKLNNEGSSYEILFQIRKDFSRNFSNTPKRRIV